MCGSPLEPIATLLFYISPEKPVFYQYNPIIPTDLASLPSPANDHQKDIDRCGLPETQKGPYPISVVTPTTPAAQSAIITNDEVANMKDKAGMDPLNLYTQIMDTRIKNSIKTANIPLVDAKGIGNLDTMEDGLQAGFKPSEWFDE